MNKVVSQRVFFILNYMYKGRLYLHLAVSHGYHSFWFERMHRFHLGSVTMR